MYIVDIATEHCNLEDAGESTEYKESSCDMNGGWRWRDGRGLYPPQPLLHQRHDIFAISIQVFLPRESRPPPPIVVIHTSTFVQVWTFNNCRLGAGRADHWHRASSSYAGYSKRVTLKVERWNKLTNLLFYHLGPCHLKTGAKCSSAWQRNGTAPAFSGGKTGSPCRCLPCLRLSPEHFFLNTCPLFHMNTWPSVTWSPDRSCTLHLFITCHYFTWRTTSPFCVLTKHQFLRPALFLRKQHFFADSLVVIYLRFDTMPNFPHKLFIGKLSVALVS